MKKLMVGLAVASISLSVGPEASIAATEVPRSIVLPVELKDPFTAYSIGLVPFYSMSAARYVGTSRLAWEPGDVLVNSANLQNEIDLVLAVIGSVFIVGGGGGASTFSGMAVLAAIPVAHSVMFAPYWGRAAVNFNRSQLEKNGFPAQDPENH